MPQTADVQSFVVQSRAASTGELPGLLHGICREMGFDHFALGYQVDQPVTVGLEADTRHPGWLVLTNWPEAWLDVYAREALAKFDPIILEMRRGNSSFTWDTLPDLRKLEPAERDVLERARRAGLGNGVAVAASCSGEHVASTLFAVSSGRTMPAGNIKMAKLVGTLALQTAYHLIASERHHPVKDSERLTQRQLDCMLLVARGKTDWEIAQVLGISETTVKWHVNEAKRRYKVPKRMQAILRAVFDGEIPLSEIMQS